MKILVAANLQIPVKNMGFDIEGIKQSYMLISHLIYIDDEGLPISYFPGTGQCLVTNIRLIFGNLNTMNMQTDHNSVLGHIFESKVLILMTETKELKLTILPLFGDQTNQDSATFKVQPYSCLRLESVVLSELQDDFFYRSPMNFEGVDCILTASQSGRKTLIAIQVTLQAKNLKEKMAKTIRGFRVLCKTASHQEFSFDRHICVLLSPLWTDFDDNYDAAKECIAGPASKKKR